MDKIQEYFNLLKTTIDSIDHNDVKKVADLMADTKNTQKKIIIFGNGGSASTASHLACDINKGISFGKEIKYRVLSLNDNIPTMLAYANDISYNDVFVEQLKNFMEQGDLVVGISGSGNSVNVIKAIEYANSKGNTTVGITGYEGGKLKQICSVSLNAPVNDMQISEDLHMIFAHLLMKLLDGK